MVWYLPAGRLRPNDPELNGMKHASLPYFGAGLYCFCDGIKMVLYSFLSIYEIFL